MGITFDTVSGTTENAVLEKIAGLNMLREEVKVMLATKGKTSEAAAEFASTIETMEHATAMTANSRTLTMMKAIQVARTITLLEGEFVSSSDNGDCQYGSNCRFNHD